MFKLLPGDRKFYDSPDVGHPSCICSRCGERILKGNPIRAWGEDKDYEYRYHPSCLGIEELEDEYDGWDEPSDVIEDSYPEDDLGACCICRCEDNVINILNLPLKTFIPGTGWGNFTTGLPADGAIAVLCDRCFYNMKSSSGQHDEETSSLRSFKMENLKDVVYGYATEKQRRPFSELTEPFGEN